MTIKPVLTKPKEKKERPVVKQKLSINISLSHQTVLSTLRNLIQKVNLKYYKKKAQFSLSHLY